MPAAGHRRLGTRAESGVDLAVPILASAALTYVYKGESMSEVLQRLLQRVRKIGVNVGVLLLDRGFCSAAVINYLRKSRTHYVLPLVARGKGDGRPALDLMEAFHSGPDRRTPPTASRLPVKKLVVCPITVTPDFFPLH